MIDIDRDEMTVTEGMEERKIYKVVVSVIKVSV